MKNTECKANRSASNFISFFLYFTLIVFLFSSCELFKPARDGSSAKKEKISKSKKEKEELLDEMQGRKVYNPETGEWVIILEVTAKLDTLEWKNLSSENYPPITSIGAYSDVGFMEPEAGEGIKNSYNVALLLPFLSKRFHVLDNEIFKNSRWALNFYGGVKMAFNLLEQEDVHLTVAVLDSDFSEAKVQNLLRTNSSIAKADLIIGPYRRSNLRLAANFARNRKVPLVSPYSASSSITEKNPFYLQLNPSIRSHCEAITRHVRKKFKTEDVILVARDIPEEKNRLRYFQEENFQIEGTRDTASFMQYIIRDTSADFHEMNVMPFIRDSATTVFILPSYKDETFVYSFLRQLAVSKTEEDTVVVYGLPQWMDFERIDFDFYENLNVFISSPTFIDNLDPEIRQFKKQFFEKYGTTAAPEALLGYDTMLYFGRMLKKYGTQFYRYLDREKAEYLHTTFDFEPVIEKPDAFREVFDQIDRFENKFVHILKYEDYHFQPAE